MKRKIIDLCVYGFSTVCVTFWFIFSVIDFFDQIHLEMTNKFWFVSMYLFYLGVFVFFVYKTVLCAIELYKAVKENKTKGGD